MSVNAMVEGLLREAVRLAPHFVAGSARQPALAPYAGPRELVEALHSGRLGPEARGALVRALVAEAQRGGRGPFRAMLLATFAPAIARRAQRACPSSGATGREDYEQEAMAALLDGVDRIAAGPYAVRELHLALRRHDQRWWQRAAAAGESESFDEELHGEAAAPADRLERRLVTELATVCASGPEPDLAAALLTAPNVRAYVDRAFSRAGRARRRAEQRRLEAARAIRPAVLWRKGSFGTDSENGSRFVERILTVVTTLRLQKRNVLDFLTAACEARLRGERPPSLLETTQNQALALAV